MQKDIWLDCDTGNDDAFAIILAGHNEKVNLIGISTVFGNNTVDKTTLNTLKITCISGLSHVKVHKGAGKPILRPLGISEGIEVHGEEGLGKGVHIPEPSYTHEKGSTLFNIY